MMNSQSLHPNDGVHVDTESRAIYRRRQQELERRDRIFDAKRRTMGIDTQTLEMQIQDKMVTKEIEGEREQAFADRMLTTEHRATLLDREVSRARKEMLQAQEEYRQLYQRPDQRREWDLNDPDSLKKDRPAREGDQDPRLGASSLQKFNGEDQNHAPRVRRQQQQLSSWVKEQMLQKQRQYDMDREVSRLEHEHALEINERRAQMEESELAARRRMNAAVKEYNQALAEARRNKERMDRMNENADGLEEIANNLRSDFLTENPQTTMNSLNPNRVLKYHFKGMSPAQLVDIRETQRSQLAEKEMLKQRSREEDDQWDLVQEAVRRNLQAGEREVSRRRMELNRQIASEQKRQAEEARARKSHLNHVVYTNAVTDDFFSQFGTTTR